MNPRFHVTRACDRSLLTYRRGFQLCVSRFDPQLICAVEADYAFPPGLSIAERLRTTVSHVKRNLTSLLRHDALDTASGGTSIRRGGLPGSEPATLCIGPPHPISNFSADDVPLTFGRAPLIKQLLAVFQPPLRPRMPSAETGYQLAEHAQDIDLAMRTLPVLSTDNMQVKPVTDDAPSSESTLPSDSMRLGVALDGRVSLSPGIETVINPETREVASQRLAEQLHTGLGTLMYELIALKNACFRAEAASPCVSAETTATTLSSRNTLMLPMSSGGTPVTPRVVCLVGPCGSGKSALAAAFAAACLQLGSRVAASGVECKGAVLHGPRGAALWNAAFRVDLRAAGTADAMYAALCSALGVASPAQDRSTAFSWLALQRHTPLGLILDNADAAEKGQLLTLLRCILKAHPTAHVVLTSRQLPLRIRGCACAALVPPLTVDLCRAVLRHGAQPASGLTEQDAHSLARYCCGLPSALQLMCHCLTHVRLSLSLLRLFKPVHVRLKPSNPSDVLSRKS